MKTRKLSLAKETVRSLKIESAIKTGVVQDPLPTILNSRAKACISHDPRQTCPQPPNSIP